MASANEDLLSKIRNDLRENPNIIEAWHEAKFMQFDEQVKVLCEHITEARLAEREPLALGKYETFASVSELAHVEELCAIAPTVKILLKLFPMGCRVNNLQKVLWSVHALTSLRKEKRADDPHYIEWLAKKLQNILQKTVFMKSHARRHD